MSIIGDMGHDERVTCVSLTIPGKPPSWKRAVPVRRGRKVTAINDQTYESNKGAVVWNLLRAIGAGNQRVWQGQRLRLEVHAYFPTRNVQDADRVLNLILDAGKGIVWRDDSWTTFEDGGHDIVPHYDRDSPRTEITITALGPLRTPGAIKAARSK